MLTRHPHGGQLDVGVGRSGDRYRPTGKRGAGNLGLHQGSRRQDGRRVNPRRADKSGHSGGNVLHRGHGALHTRHIGAGIHIDQKTGHLNIGGAQGFTPGRGRVSQGGKKSAGENQ